MATEICKVTQSWFNAAGTNRWSVTTSLAGQVEEDVTQDVPTVSVNLPINAAFIKANLVGIELLSDQAMVIKTNSTSSPSDTLNLVAGVPYFWYAGSGITNPFATDVTIMYASTPGIMVTSHLTGTILHN